MPFSEDLGRASSKVALKQHIRVHNELARRPKIPEEAFSKIDDAPTATADLWLEAHDSADEDGKGKALFQIMTERELKDLHERDIEDLAGGHYYLSPEESLLIVPAKNFCSAAGGFGVVWNGTIKDNIFAVKTITGAASLALEWKLEREILKSLRHEHLVRLLFSMEQENTVHMIIHPYAPITLSRALAPTGSPIDLKKHGGWLENSFCCLLSALRFLHSKNIKHLDLKPQNILIDDSVFPPNILISNFGASRRFTITSAPDPLEQSEFTRWYTAPEQFISQGRRSADVFSMGVIFLEIFVFIRMGIKARSPQQILSDPKGLSHEGAGKIGNHRVQSLVGKLSESAVAWLAEVASMAKAMLAYTPMERPTARQAHMRMVHIVVGGAAAELHCPAPTKTGPDMEDNTIWEDRNGDVPASGVLDEFLRTMRKNALMKENNIPDTPSKTINTCSPPPTPALLLPTSGSAIPVNTSGADQPESSETPRKRALEDTELNEAGETERGEEEVHPKRRKSGL